MSAHDPKRTFVGRQLDVRYGPIVDTRSGVAGVLESEAWRQAFVVDSRFLSARLFVDELTLATAPPADCHFDIVFRVISFWRIQRLDSQLDLWSLETNTSISKERASSDTREPGVPRLP